MHSIVIASLLVSCLLVVSVHGNSINRGGDGGAGSAQAQGGDRARIDIGGGNGGQGGSIFANRAGGFVQPDVQLGSSVGSQNDMTFSGTGALGNTPVQAGDVSLQNDMTFSGMGALGNTPIQANGNIVGRF